MADIEAASRVSMRHMLIRHIFGAVVFLFLIYSLRKLNENYNTFLAMLRKVFLTLRQQGVNIAVSSAIVASKISISSRHAQMHSDLGDEIFTGTRESLLALSKASNNAKALLESTCSNLGKAKKNIRELNQVNSDIDELSARDPAMPEPTTANFLSR